MSKFSGEIKSNRSLPVPLTHTLSLSLSLLLLLPLKNYFTLFILIEFRVN